MKDTVTASIHDAEKWERAHGPENDGDLHELRNEGRESDFRMEADWTDCGACEQTSCLRCAFGRKYGGAA